jgi:tetratricopeptide (TPR) repeat protein
MRRIALAALMLVATVAPALSAGYSFLNVGIDYFNQERYSDAIIWFDKAIDAGDLVPDQMRAAYYGRGMAHAVRREFSDAISSYTAALALKPGDGSIARDRASAYLATGQVENAFADLNIAHLKYPNDYLMDFQTGLVAWQLGRYDDARAVFVRHTKRYSNAWLWLQLANAKLGMPPVSIEDTKFDAKQWPNPLKALYAGQIDADAVLKAQRESPAAGAEACDANFYVGQWRLVHGEIVAGKPLMQKAAEVCDGTSLEKSMAFFEVKKLMGQ